MFVEVKYRSSKEYGDALEAVTNDKAKKIIKTAWDYLQNNNGASKPWRIDAIEITKLPGSNNYDITHVINAIYG